MADFERKSVKQFAFRSSAHDCPEPEPLVVATGKMSDMEFLDQIITSIKNDPAPVIAVALAALIGVVGGSLILGLWRLFFRTIPLTIRNTGWPFCYGLFLKAQIKYRQWRSKQIMAAYLSGMTLTVPAEGYESFLGGNPLTSDRRGLEAVRPSNPRWLNGYYVQPRWRLYPTMRR